MSVADDQVNQQLRKEIYWEEKVLETPERPFRAHFACGCRIARAQITLCDKHRGRLREMQLAPSHL